jgi:hypothetical protein
MIRLERSGVNLKEDSLTLEDGRRGDQVVPSQARSASEY